MPKLNSLTTLIDTKNLNLSYESYVKFCMDSQRTPDLENGVAFKAWKYDERKYIIKDFLENIKSYNDPVLITGSIYIGENEKPIYPLRMEGDQFNNSLYNAVMKCINGSNDFKIVLDNGVIVIDSYHYDYKNTFEIHKLSFQGEIVSRHILENGKNKYGKNMVPKGFWFQKFRLYNIFGNK